MPSPDQRLRVAAVAAAHDPVRGALLSFALGSRDGFSRDEAAESAGIPRATAAFHLDKLAELGLLEVEYHRRGVRTGPGAGRPAKFYRARVDEVCASIPERHYDFAAEILFDAVELAERTDVPVSAALDEVAVGRGRMIGSTAPSLPSALEAGGYEPRADGAEVTLTNCPFHRLTARHAATICGINHAFLRGVLEGAGENPARAEFAPAAGQCCVRIAGSARLTAGAPSSVIED